MGPMTNADPSMNVEVTATSEEASLGEVAAARSLLGSQRERLRRLIAARLDRRLAARLDPSDVVQETLADAARRLPDYLRDRPLPFYAWLFRLAADRVARIHRDHVRSSVRGIGREERIDGLARTRPAQHGAEAADGIARVVNAETTPGSRMVREERRVLLFRALDRMEQADQEILKLRYVDHLAFEEIATLLGIRLSAARMRHLRALERLRPLLEELGMDPSRSS